MKREIAEKMTEIARKIDGLWDELDTVINQIGDEDEKRRLKRGLGRLMADMHVKITLEAVRDFPELHPDADHLKN